ncbi:hypothetical protein VNO77_04705 [Canavalia gladiata]|uniref:Uncharacterized protein n=1 Tax=Canavalia gladiata TaxID=3824 RepID=A0AAN9N3I3_CANGL
MQHKGSSLGKELNEVVKCFGLMLFGPFGIIEMISYFRKLARRDLDKSLEMIRIRSLSLLLSIPLLGSQWSLRGRVDWDESTLNILPPFKHLLPNPAFGGNHVSIALTHFVDGVTVMDNSNFCYDPFLKRAHTHLSTPQRLCCHRANQ